MEQIPTNSIIVASDLSARSDRPVERALLLRDQLNSSLLILHVPESDRNLSPDEEQRLTEIFRTDFGLEPGDAEIVFENGSVGSTIARVAEERGCSLVITGVAHFNSISDFVLGTAVERLVHRSAAPVLVVKRKAMKPYERLLVTTDFTDCSKRTLLIAADLFPRAEFRLIHAYHAPYEAFLSHETTVDFVRSEAERSMARLVQKLPEPVRSRLAVAVEEGEHVAEVVGRNIRDWRADLLVLCSEEYGGFALAETENEGLDLLVHDPADVLIVTESTGWSDLSG